MNTVRWLITEKGVDKFLFGSKSNFDDFCQEVVKELREEYPYIKRVYVRMYYPELGEPYIGYILRDFEDTYMPERIENAGVVSFFIIYTPSYYFSSFFALFLKNYLIFFTAIA